MNNIYEINMLNAQRDVDTGRVKQESPVVEVFSALTSGVAPKVDAKTKDAAVKTLKDLGAKAHEGDKEARSEVNSIVRFAIQPKLLKQIELYRFLGSHKKLDWNEAAYMKTYNYESIDSRFQASSGDVPFGFVNWREYPIATQTISGGIAVDYREIATGNFDGNLAEAMNQVKIDMQNKIGYYTINTLYNAIKYAKGVKHFSEAAGVNKQAVDDMLKVMRRYGKVNICGDYSVVSQLNEFEGFKTIGAVTIPFGDATVAEEIRKTGLVNWYNGAFVTELQNQINFTKLNATGDDYELYMPQGLLFFLPEGAVSPVQSFVRGNLTTMSGDDIVTRQHMIRLDLEFGCGVAEGMEHQIGLISDSNYDLPTV